MSQTINAFLRRDGSNPTTGDLNLNMHKIMHLDEPAADDDAVTRKYVDNSVQVIDTVVRS
jgi:hypothetical protein